ncbi:MAG TPA: monovalent cation/H+ antiporter complex subunit F [Gaiellaceae bacterium]
MNAFTIAATALLVGFVPIGVVCLRFRELDGVVAIELAGALAALVFLCLGEGFHRSAYFDLPVVCAALAWVSGMVFVRFFARNDEEDG